MMRRGQGLVRARPSSRLGAGVDFGEKTTFIQWVQSIAARRHMCVEFVLGLSLAQARLFPFLAGYSGFPLSSNTNNDLQIPNIKFEKKPNKNPLIADQSNIYSCVLPVGNV